MRILLINPSRLLNPLNTGVRVVHSVPEGCTVNQLTSGMLKVMKASGCSRLHIGIESGTDRVLRRMKKVATVRESVEAVHRVHSFGIEIVGYFMFGYPGESRSEVQATLDLSRSLPIEFARYSICTPMAGTTDYLESVRAGLYPDFYREYIRRFAGAVKNIVFQGGFEL